MPGTTYLIFQDAINDQSASRFVDFTTKAIAKHDPEMLYFLFSSSGGFVNPGIALYNFLRALPQHTAMHNMGSIDSIGNAVFLGAERRFASPTSTFLLHGISWTFGQGSTLTFSQMQETISRLDAAEQLSARIMGERTRLSVEEVRALFKQGESKNPQFALEKGMIHEIRDPQIQQGAPVYTITG